MSDHHAAAGERHLERQRRTLEKCRQKNLDVALATDLLHTLEWSQRQPIERRDYLRRQLAAAL